MIGNVSWSKHVYETLNTTRLYRNKAPNGNYRIQLNFYIDIDGSVSEVTLDKKIGFGVEEEAIRLLKSAGKWEPGVINGFKVRMPTQLIIAFKLERQIADD